MKRTFLAKRNALLSGQPISWGAWALFLALLLVCVRTFLPGIFWKITSPFFGVSQSISAGMHIFSGGFSNTEALAQENDTLKNVNATLAAENKTLAAQVADLTGLTASTTEAASTGIRAGVITRPPTSPYDTLLVGAGASEGVVEHMEAFGDHGVAIGFVSSVSPHTSRITLFSSPSFKTDGWLGNEATPITLMGEGGGAFTAAIARTVEVSVGDTVSVPGPGRIVIGSVSRVDNDPLSPAVNLNITPLINPFSITWVTLRMTGAPGFQTATSTEL